MSTIPGRQRFAARFIVCACAIVCACSKPDAPGPSAAVSADAAGSEPAGSSELQDWAKHATMGASDQSGHAAVARAPSDALATPVIHTVD